MWIADNWKDYEVLDASGGEKLERWGDYILIRPDPQVIWNTPRSHGGWKKKNAHYHRSAQGGGEWEFFRLPDEWSISYFPGTRVPGSSVERCRSAKDSASAETDTCTRDRAPAKDSTSAEAGTSARPDGTRRLTFRLKPFSFKHTGLFPEQAANWEWFSSLIRAAGRPAHKPVKVLNLFAYTGGATLAAAAAGAAVTHVDASKGMVAWAKENAAASGLKDAPIRWLVDDCVKFVEREIRRGSRYDAVIMDPPSYGRGPKGEIWKIEEGIWPFIELTTHLLSDDAVFYLVNSYTTGLQPAVLSYILNSAVAKRFGGHVEADEIGLPVRTSALTLPCGAAGRWTKS